MSSAYLVTNLDLNQCWPSLVMHMCSIRWMWVGHYELLHCKYGSIELGHYIQLCQSPNDIAGYFIKNSNDKRKKYILKYNSNSQQTPQLKTVCGIALRWILQAIFDEWSILNHVMACCQAATWINVVPILCHHMASLGHNMLTVGI